MNKRTRNKIMNLLLIVEIILIAFGISALAAMVPALIITWVITILQGWPFWATLFSLDSAIALCFTIIMLWPGKSLDKSA